MTDLDALLTQLTRATPAHPRAAVLANASLAVGRFAARWADGDEAAFGDGKISAAYEATASRLGGDEHAQALASALPAAVRSSTWADSAEISQTRWEALGGTQHDQGEAEGARLAAIPCHRVL